MKRLFSSQACGGSSLLRRKAGLFVWALLAGLLLMNGLAVLSLSHAVQHESHNPGTHHTGLCAWLCAAGQAAELSSVHLEFPNRLVDLIVVPLFPATASATFFHAFLRGPPAFAA